MPYDSSIIQNERKSYQMHHIMRERREASISVENKVAAMQNEGKDSNCQFLNSLFLSVSDLRNNSVEQAKFVEFFNPKYRRELDKKDEEHKKSYGYKGAAPGGDDWTWLTNYCRIPVNCGYLFDT